MDLNLLTALDALLEECSVQGAAERLHLTPPAMSRTLTRIRRATGDEILVRSGRTMVPTPRALAIREQVRDVVRHAHELLAAEQGLDLGRLRRTFVVRAHESLVGPLTEHLVTSQDEAPGVTWRFLPEEVDDSPALVRGRVDLELGSAGPGGADIRTEVLGHDRQVLAMRRGHPLARPGALTVAAYAGAHHVVVSRRGRLRDAVDEALAALGESRRVVAALPTGAAALQVAAGSDAVVAVAARTSARLLSSLDLVVRDLPVTTPELAVVAAWHRRNDGDPAHTWLRRTVRDAWKAAAG